MHEMVLRIKEPELCYIFARNAERRGHPELGMEDYSFAAVRAAYPKGFDQAAA